MPIQPIRTPCIGVCSTVFGGNVCRGCKRFAHEVDQWNGLNQGAKASVWKRLNLLMEQVVGCYFTVTDSNKLAATLQTCNVRYNPDATPYYWLYELLRYNNGKLPADLEPIGVQATLTTQLPPADRVFNILDKQLFELAEAYHDANFIRAHHFQQIIQNTEQ